MKGRAIVLTANIGDDSITVYDSESYRLLCRLALKPAGIKLMNINYFVRGPITGPGYLYHRKSENQLLVANLYDDSLSIIDLATFEITNTIFAGSRPNRIAVLERKDRAFVTNYDSDRVSVVDLKYQEIIAQIPCGIMPQSIVLGSQKEYLYIANTGSEYITIIDAPSMYKLDCLKVDGYPVDICCDKAEKRLYAIINFNEGLDAHCLAEYDITSGSMLKQLRLGSMPVDLAYHQETGRFYVLDAAENRLTIVDSSSLDILDTVELGRMPIGQSLEPDGRYLHVACMIDNCLCKVDTHTGTVEDKVYTGVEPACVLIMD